MDISRCSASVARGRTRCSRTWTRYCARRGRTRPTSTGSRSASAPAASPGSASGSRRRAGLRSRSTSPARASRPWRRSPPALRRRCRSSTPSGARSSPSSAASRACSTRRSCRWTGEPSASATARSATGSCSRSAGPSCRRTTTSATCRAPASTRRWPESRGRWTSSSRCISGCPMPRGTSDDDDRAAPARARRPPRDRGDRAPFVPDPVVALDVRGRARQAELDLPRRLRGGGRGRRARRLPDRLALRRRLARDERRRRPRPPRPRRRDHAPRAALRPHGRRRSPGLHARGAHLEREGDLALRASRLPLSRPAARLLHRQPRGRADHVEGPGSALILGIETSCDETAAALLTDDGVIRSSVVSSQAELHARYGGVVPEVASRRHLELVTPVIREALAEADATLEDVDSIAVTQGPGLIGALLVGLAAAKAIAWSRRLPLVPVDHLDGHVASLYLQPDPLEPPFLCLLASGGHTMLLDVRSHSERELLGSTLDDAAGEAFDKGARLLGLGYPGGREIDRLARDGDPGAYDFPVARVPGLDFSFSGLKTALLYAVRELGEEELESRRADLAASYQHAIVRALAERVRAAAGETGRERIAIVGGVAANSALRAALPDAAAAPLALCTDNAAMIASAARWTEAVPYPRYLALDAYASR